VFYEKKDRQMLYIYVNFLGLELLRLRAALKWPRWRLAEELGVTEMTAVRWEHREGTARTFSAYTQTLKDLYGKHGLRKTLPFKIHKTRAAAIGEMVALGKMNIRQRTREQKELLTCARSLSAAQGRHAKRIKK